MTIAYIWEPPADDDMIFREGGYSEMGPMSLEGQTLGKYRILEALGRGGMARVYRAYHPHLERYVAIKVMRADLADDEEFQVRFQREAQAVARLRHPNIVQVFDFDSEGEISFMVMELLEGDTLKTRLGDYRVRGEQMPWGEMVRVMLDVLDGLAYAHSEGMIHRDIKPGNILLTRRGQAVLGDFGVAHIIGGTRYTAPHALMGTLQYMAPEQGLEGRSDARSDIYSLGIVFYEMLTQRRPFDADTPLAVLMKHVNDPLPLPRQINADIPEALECVVLKALAKKPEDRYQGAVVMARTLRAAAEEAEIDLPTQISLPLSFSTPEAPAESVAVISGTTRKMLVASDFADDETDVTSQQLMATLSSTRTPNQEALNTAGRDLVNAAEAVLRVVAQRASDAAHKVTQAAERAMEGQSLSADGVPDTPSPDMEVSDEQIGAENASTQDRVHHAILIALSLLGVGNFLMLTFAALIGRWQIYMQGWPIQLLLVTVGLCMVMHAASSIWLLIPTGIILGNGLLFTYSALTNKWEHWVFLWLLEVWVVALSIITPITLARNKSRAQSWSQQLAWLLGTIAAVLALFVAVMTMLGPWFVLGVCGVSILWWLRRKGMIKKLSRRKR